MLPKLEGGILLSLVSGHTFDVAMTDVCIVKSCIQTNLALNLQGCAVGHAHSVYRTGVIVGGSQR